MLTSRLTIGLFAAVLCSAALAPGCALTDRRLGLAPPVGNPMFVASNNESAVWERTVDVVHEFNFSIAREDRQARVIETAYFVGSGILEPWHRDSVGLANRLESTLQSVRRKVVVSLTPDEQGHGYLVSVEAFKELEDLPGLAANSPGGATFNENAPLTRDLNPVVGQSSPSGWIPVGRDLALETEMLAELNEAYSTP